MDKTVYTNDKGKNLIENSYFTEKEKIREYYNKKSDRIVISESKEWEKESHSYRSKGDAFRKGGKTNGKKNMESIWESGTQTERKF